MAVMSPTANSDHHWHTAFKNQKLKDVLCYIFYSYTVDFSDDNIWASIAYETALACIFWHFAVFE